jgi:hypothetical protein
MRSMSAVETDELVVWADIERWKAFWKAYQAEI